RFVRREERPPRPQRVRCEHPRRSEHEALAEAVAVLTSRTLLQLPAQSAEHRHQLGRSARLRPYGLADRQPVRQYDILLRYPVRKDGHQSRFSTSSAERGARHRVPSKFLKPRVKGSPRRTRSERNRGRAFSFPCFFAAYVVRMRNIRKVGLL